MNGNLSFAIINDYVSNKQDIKLMEEYLVVKTKMEDFDKELFYKFVDTYKYARNQTNEWDEDAITRSLIKDIIGSISVNSKLTFNVFKAKGKYETNFGDIAFIIRFNYKNGNSFEGFGFIESKRDYPDKKYRFNELKKDQMIRFLKNTKSSFYCFYSHKAFFPTVKTEYLYWHLENLQLQDIKHLDYPMLVNTIKPITFQNQLNRFFNGYDLDYGDKPKNIAYGFDEEFLPKTVFVIDQFENGMTPTPTPTPLSDNEKYFSLSQKFISEEIEKTSKKNKKDNDINDDYNMGGPGF